MSNDWFMDYASHRVRLIALEQEWLEIRYWHLFDEQERRGWITKNGRHILIGEDSGGGKSGEKVDKSGESGIIRAEEVKTVALENQRYGRNKETLVNKSYIDSGEYKRKFDNATDNPKVNKALYDCSKEALKHRSGTAFEDMYWIDATTGEIIHSVTDSTDERAIRYTESIKKALSGKSNIITLHTHPSSMPPSVDDFNSCYNNNYTEGYIACHNGKVFRYTSEQEISETLYNLYMNEFIEEGLEEFDAQIMTLKKIMENHSVSFMEV